MLFQVSRIGFRLTCNSGTGAGAAGIPRLLKYPAAATSMPPSAIHAGCSTEPANKPPASVPIKIATKVPASISALPPTSSVSCRCCGRMAYLTGPNSVECRPSKNSAPISTDRLCRKKPMAATPMMTISSTLTNRASNALSYLSASCPAVAENRKKGRINTPAARLASNSGLSVVHCAAWKVSRTISAFLNRLSLNAPRNCVIKKGPKRFCLRSPNCPLMPDSQQ